jgi:hypothetical protein
MTWAGKATAYVCIFSILLMGCYTSTLIDLTGDNKDKINSGEIQFVVTKDSTKCEFQEPPTIVKDSIVGKVNDKQVSIPISNVAMVGIEEANYAVPALIAFGVLAITVAGVLIWANQITINPFDGFKEFK